MVPAKISGGNKIIRRVDVEKRVDGTERPFHRPGPDTLGKSRGAANPFKRQHVAQGRVERNGPQTDDGMKTAPGHRHGRCSGVGEAGEEIERQKGGIARCGQDCVMP